MVAEVTGAGMVARAAPGAFRPRTPGGYLENGECYLSRFQVWVRQNTEMQPETLSTLPSSVILDL